MHHPNLPGELLDVGRGQALVVHLLQRHLGAVPVGGVDDAEGPGADATSQLELLRRNHPSPRRLLQRSLLREGPELTREGRVEGWIVHVELVDRTGRAFALRGERRVLRRRLTDALRVTLRRRRRVELGALNLALLPEANLASQGPGSVSLGGGQDAPAAQQRHGVGELKRAALGQPALLLDGRRLAKHGDGRLRFETILSNAAGVRGEPLGGNGIAPPGTRAVVVDARSYAFVDVGWSFVRGVVVGLRRVRFLIR